MARGISLICQVCGGRKALWVPQPKTGVMSMLMMMVMMNGNHDHCSCEKMVPWSLYGRNLGRKKLSRLKKDDVQVFSSGGIFPGKSRRRTAFRKLDGIDVRRDFMADTVALSSPRRISFRLRFY
ncbi:dexamethasone-induced protein homolog isoform X1 [Hemibagrus wyckioides]|nr:dexamethasone-induced protein homolog isoform X1 [Hemibagrus wyckioides]